MKTLFFITLLAHMSVYAQVKVAFIKVIKPDCNILMLEPHFEYSHVAISYHNGVEQGWLNAHPKHGVQFTKTLEEIGFPEIEYTILENDLMPEVLPNDIIAGKIKYRGRYLKVKDLIGKPYDKQYSWNSGYSYYCSELIAKILGIKPRAMTFDSKLWPKEYQELNGRPGISPFLLLEEMLRRGFLTSDRRSF